MVRSSNFAASSGKRHKSASIRAIKEAPAALSRPFHPLTGATFTHTPSRSVPNGPHGSSSQAPISGLSSLQAIQALLGELECLPKFPLQRIEALSLLRYAAMLISWRRAPLTISLLAALEFYFVEAVFRQRQRRAWNDGIGALKLKLRSLSKHLLLSKDLDSLYTTVSIQAELFPSSHAFVEL